MVTVSAKESMTENSQTIVVKSPYGLNNTQISVMRKKIQFWMKENRKNELRDKFMSLCYSYEDLLTKKSVSALSWYEINVLKANQRKLVDLLEKDASAFQLEDSLSDIKHILESSLERVTQYEKLINECVVLSEAIGKFTDLLREKDENEAMNLCQGRKLLEEYAQCRLSYCNASDGIGIFLQIY